MAKTEIDKLEDRIEDLEALINGDPNRPSQEGLATLVSGLRSDFDNFKEVWDARASFFRGLFWAVSANGLLGIAAIVLQIVGG